MRNHKGVTLAESLITLAIMSIVLALATGGIVLAMRMQSSQEAVTSSQAKLRRVSEALTQEIRGAVLGGISNLPYASSANSVSFTRLEGGAGYKVLSTSSTVTQFVAAETSVTDLDFGTGQALLVSSNGNAMLLDVNAITYLGANQFSLSHTSCTTAFSFTQDTLLFKVSTLGFNYDASQEVILQTIGLTELPLAFDITNFRIDYVYEKVDGTPVVQATPLLVDGIPQRQGVIAGDNVNLARLQLVLSTRARSINNWIERTYTNQVELFDNISDPRFRVIQEVKSCT